MAMPPTLTHAPPAAVPWPASFHDVTANVDRPAPGHVLRPREAERRLGRAGVRVEGRVVEEHGQAGVAGIAARADRRQRVPDLERPEVRRIAGHARDRVDEEPAAVEPLQADGEVVLAAGREQRPQRGRSGERVAGERAGDRHGSDWVTVAAGPFHPHLDVHGGGRGRGLWRLPGRARPIGLPRRPGDGGGFSPTCPPSSRGVVVRRAAGLLARARLPGSPGRPACLPGLEASGHPIGCAGRTPSQRRDRAGIAPASLDRPRGAECTTAAVAWTVYVAVAGAGRASAEVERLAEEVGRLLAGPARSSSPAAWAG